MVHKERLKICVKNFKLFFHAKLFFFCLCPICEAKMKSNFIDLLGEQVLDRDEPK